MGAIYSRLRLLFDDGEGPGGWWICFEVELHLGSEVLVPDLSGWRRERVPEFPVSGAAATIAPDWVCEVLSPRTALLDRARKLPSYASHGVKCAWIIDTNQKTIEVFQLANGQWVLSAVHGGDEPARIEPFEAVELPLARLWLSDPRPA